MSKIHPTAIVDPSAELDDTVEIGAYSVVEGNVKIGAGTVLHPHVVIRSYTEIGASNQIHPFSVLGGDPQDSSLILAKYDGAIGSPARAVGGAPSIT